MPGRHFSIRGHTHFKKTLTEKTAGVKVVDEQKEPGDFRRYGAQGDDSTDDFQALTDAFASGHKAFGHPEDVYRINSDIVLPASLEFNGNGCTIKPVGVPRLIRDAPAADTSTTISSGATQGSVVVVVASATGLAVGRQIRIASTGFPSFWAKIKAIASTTITLDHAVPLDYTGTINFHVYDAGTLGGALNIDNVLFDGSLNTGAASSSGEAMRIGGYESVNLNNVRCTGYDTTVSVVLLQIYICLDVQVNGCNLYDNSIQSSSNNIDIQDGRKVICIANVIEGSGFGINITRCSQGFAVGNILTGRRTWERSQSVAYSTRGIKFTSVGTALASGNSVDDYSSPIRVDIGFRSVIVGNAVKNADWHTSDTGGQAISISASDSSTQFGATIMGNVLENCGGLGIGVDNGATNGDGRTIVSGNYLRNLNGRGIYCNDRDCTITDNIIDEWAVDGAADGIHYSSGATVSGNRFHNSDNTRICMRTFLDGGFEYVFANNVAVDGNPLFASSGVIENSGTATILDTTTAITVTHNILGTPDASEIQLTPTENPTNTPGVLWVDTITATQFNINCENDPGASNLDVAWRAKKAMPFTA